jgi:predicted lipoprotein with Yx(FWY)xxD motif
MERRRASKEDTMRRMRMRYLWAMVVPSLALLILAGCAGAAGGGGLYGGGGGGSTGGATSGGTGAVTIHTKSITVNGKAMTVLADAKGLTLYYFTADTTANIACGGSCAQLWPPLLAPSGTPTSTVMLPGMFGVVNGANGRQVTYLGHPLYTFSKDKDVGDAYGQGFMGMWFAVTPGVAPLSSGAGAGAGAGGYGY